MNAVPTRILFVCLGNICRSPQAEALCQAYLEASAQTQKFVLASAGTGSWHIGKGADQRSAHTAKQHGVDLSQHRAQQIHANNYKNWDTFVVMDRSNYTDLLSMGIKEDKIILMRFSEGDQDVPDPYYGGEQGFEQVFGILKKNAPHVMQYFFDRYA